MLGFLEYVFLPSALIGVLDYDTKRKYVVDGFAEMLDDLHGEKYATPDRIAYMEFLCYRLRSLWDEDESGIRYGLQRWSAHFNSNWLEEPGIGFSFLVHDGPEAAIRHRINWEDRDLSDGATKEIWGRPVEWLQSYRDEDIYCNPLMNKQFMQMLKREFSYSI